MVYPLCIQQFYHHGGRLWKIYVVGSYVHALSLLLQISLILALQVFLEKEGSVEAVADVASGVMHFNGLEMKRHDVEDKQDSFQPDPSAILGTAEALRTSTGLTVFGFDVIIDADSRRAFVIDVNHFPSMKRVKPSVPALYESLYNAICTYQKQSSEPPASL